MWTSCISGPLENTSLLSLLLSTIPSPVLPASSWVPARPGSTKQPQGRLFLEITTQQQKNIVSCLGGPVFTEGTTLLCRCEMEPKIQPTAYQHQVLWKSANSTEAAKILKGWLLLTQGVSTIVLISREQSMCEPKCTKGRVLNSKDSKMSSLLVHRMEDKTEGETTNCVGIYIQRKISLT